MNKTGRKRGLVRKAIRVLAANRKQFTIDDLCPPLTLEQARRSCGAMNHEGELKRITKAYRVSSTVIRTVYGPANLRPAHLTGVHL